VMILGSYHALSSVVCYIYRILHSLVKEIQNLIVEQTCKKRGGCG
jgi:hypothetical protein